MVGGKEAGRGNNEHRRPPFSTLYFCFSYILVFFYKIIYTYDLSLLVRCILADRSILGACYFRKLVPNPQTPTEKKVKNTYG